MVPNQLLAQFTLETNERSDVAVEIKTLDVVLLKKTLDELAPDYPFANDVIEIIKVCNERFKELNDYLFEHYQEIVEDENVPTEM